MNEVAEFRTVVREQLAKGVGAVEEWSTLESPDVGGTFRELAVVLEEVGRAAATGPYLGTAVLAAATGTGADTVALDGRTVGIVPSTDFRISRRSEGYRLHGSAEFVPDAPDAQRILVPALDDGGALLLCTVDASTLAITAAPLLDETRSLGTVHADDVLVSHDRIRDLGYTSDLLARLRDRAAVALAADALGVGEAVLARTVDHVAVRHQFGRPIGSFQAVKHTCADMLTQLTVARELVARAVDALVAQDPDAWVHAAMAKSYATETAVAAAGSAMQLHGGIGYTWESGIHVYLKRAMADRELFGSPTEHRELLARRYGSR